MVFVAIIHSINHVLVYVPLKRDNVWIMFNVRGIPNDNVGSIPQRQKK
jgi:hypothetical protein